MKARVDYEQRFYTALRRIVAYDSPGQLRRQSERRYGVSFEEGIEMAYENIQQEARDALRGFRKKRSASPRPDPAVGQITENPT